MSEIRTQIDSNINNAAYLAEKHPTSMGALGRANRLVSAKQSRPLTASSHAKKYSLVKGVKPKINADEI